MKINVYYDEEGISILDILSEDFLLFLKDYIKENLKQWERDCSKQKRIDCKRIEKIFNLCVIIKLKMV